MSRFDAATPVGSVVTLAELAVHPDAGAREAVLRRVGGRAAAGAVAEMVAEAHTFMDAYRLDGRRGTPDDTLVGGLVTYFLWALAAGEQVPSIVLEFLSVVDDHRVRTAASMHPDAPADVLETLSQDKSASVRAAVAEHCRTPYQSLSELAADDDAQVRANVAANPTTVEQVRMRLVADVAYTVRSNVYASAENRTSVRLAMAVRLAESYVGDPDGLEQAVEAVLGRVDRQRAVSCDHRTAWAAG